MSSTGDGGARDPGPAPRPIAVGVYDQPELVVFGVRAMFDRQDNRAVVRPLADARVSTTIDAVLCDPVGRDVDIADYVERITTLTAAPIVVFSWVEHAHVVRRALAAGACAFVSKSASSRELVEVLEAVHGGVRVDPPPVADDGLSMRESDVLHLICRGLSNGEIAAELYISVNSVKTYIRQIYAKTGVQRRAQAVAWGIARGY